MSHLTNMIFFTKDQKPDIKLIVSHVKSGKDIMGNKLGISFVKIIGLCAKYAKKLTASAVFMLQLQRYSAHGPALWRPETC